MKYTELYFAIQTYGFFIMLGILALLIVFQGVYFLVNKIKKRKNKKEKENERE